MAEVQNEGWGSAYSIPASISVKRRVEENDRLMGYNTTLGPLNRWASVLDEIHAGTFQIASNDPKTLAYRLHEALESARVNKVEPYASMELKFRTSPGYLYVEAPNELVVVSGVGTQEVFPAAITSFDVVQSASGHSTGTLIFPSFNGENLKMVETWAKAKGWKIEMEENTLILTSDSIFTNQ